MRTNKKLYSVALASAALILFLIWISSTASVSIQYFTNWIRKSSSFIPISRYFSVKCLKS